MNFDLSEIDLSFAPPILGSKLGRSVGISNKPSIILGGPNYNEYQGVIRMFDYDPTIDDYNFFDEYGTPGSNFGFDVDIEYDGDHIIVGAPELSLDGTGYIKLFVRDFSGSLLELADVSGTTIGDYFGYSVAIEKWKINDNIYFAGASRNGYVKVYLWQNDTVTQVGNDILENNVSKIRFAKSNWRFLAIGKPQNNRVSIYNFDSNLNDWIKVGNNL